MQIDRGFIKWMPFDSVASTKGILNSANKERIVVKMPKLSEEQIISNENNLLSSYHNKEQIKIIYFKNNTIYKTVNKVLKIDAIKKSITLENNNIIYFSQIIQTLII